MVALIIILGSALFVWLLSFGIDRYVLLIERISRPKVVVGLPGTGIPFYPLAQGGQLPTEIANILGVQRDADQTTLKKAYRTKSKDVHPDHGGDPNDWHKLKEAYRIALELSV